MTSHNGAPAAGPAAADPGPTGYGGAGSFGSNATQIGGNIAMVFGGARRRRATKHRRRKTALAGGKRRKSVRRRRHTRRRS